MLLLSAKTKNLAHTQSHKYLDTLFCGIFRPMRCRAHEGRHVSQHRTCESFLTQCCCHHSKSSCPPRPDQGCRGPEQRFTLHDLLSQAYVLRSPSTNSEVFLPFFFPSSEDMPVLKVSLTLARTPSQYLSHAYSGSIHLPSRIQ